MTTTHVRQIATAALAFAALLASASADARSVVVTRRLVTTGVTAGRGEARLRILDRRHGLDGRLDVRVRGLAPRTTFAVAIDAVPIGALATDRRGRGRASFDSRARGGRALLGVDPRGRTVSVTSDDGTPVLVGAISSASLDPRKVRCCLPDDSGTECEDRTAAECAAQGGIDLGAGSCLPSPCASTSPTAGDVRCCLPDDSGPECEDRTAVECSAQGGINLGTGSCTPNPCRPSVTTTTVPGATTTTLPGGVGAVIEVRCEHRTGRSKISVNGNNLAGGTYRARVTSGSNMATADARPTIGDEVEFDFDSDSGDIAAGATPIAPDFIGGAAPAVHGELLDAGGGVVAAATRSCAVR